MWLFRFYEFAQQEGETISINGQEYGVVYGIPPIFSRAALRMLVTKQSWKNLFKKNAPEMDIQFGNNPNQVHHVFRHTDKLGLGRQAVQNAIRKDLQSAASNMKPSQPLNQVIEVGGQRIQYTGFQLPNGTINVGRVHGAP